MTTPTDRPYHESIVNGGEQPDRSPDMTSYAEQLQQEIRDLRAAVAHWKAAHDEMVARNKLLRDRPDLPTELYADRMGWREKLKDLEATVARLRRGEFTPEELQELCNLDSDQFPSRLLGAAIDACDTYKADLDAANAIIARLPRFTKPDGTPGEPMIFPCNGWRITTGGNVHDEGFLFKTRDHFVADGYMYYKGPIYETQAEAEEAARRSKP